MSDHITIFEVGPRDGLQNESGFVASADKIKLVNLLSKCGFSKIEVTSFVSPKWVPQMADGADVLAKIIRREGVSYSALTPNMRGYENARNCNVDEVAVFAAASETFSQKNINCSIAESIARFAPIFEAAKSDNVPVRGYVSCVVGCPYEGEISAKEVARTASTLIEAGCYEVSLGDTIGIGTPQSVSAMLDAVLCVVPANKLAGHFHDTNGMALANIQTSMAKGLRVFDSAIGGLGGCPYAPGAKGNVATGEVVALMANKGMITKIDADALNVAQAFLETIVK